MDIEGLGIIFYSLSSVKEIEDGEDYLSEHYIEPEDVLNHIYNGTLVGFGTGSPGRFQLNLFVGPAPLLEESNPDFSLKLGIQVSDNKIYLNDLYVLMYWEKDHFNVPFLELESGSYEVAVDSWRPSSGYIGDNQKINMYFTKVDRLPKLKYNGVPTLYNFEDKKQKAELEKSDWTERPETIFNRETTGKYQTEWQMKFDLVKPGIIFYSLNSVEFLKEGQNFLYKEGSYYKPETMLKYNDEGSLVGFLTGSMGTFFLHILVGQMPSTSVTKPEFTFKLYIQVTDNKVYFNEMDVLISWKKDHESIPYIELENGFYEVAVDSWASDSGKLGHNQQINLYFLKVDTLPKLEYKLIPQFNKKFKNNRYAKNPIHSDENYIE